MADPFCWYELMTTDAAAAEAFYGKVVGWTFEAMPGSDIGYMLAKTTAGAIGGLFNLSPDMTAMGVRPAWVGYVAVADVDASATRAIALGGAMHKAPEDIPNVGRFAMMADPGGAVFVLFQPNDAGTPPPTGAVPGQVGWRELMAGDLDREWAFYEALFGWTKVRDHDMGPMGPYRLFSDHGGGDTGGIMTKPPFVPVSFWGYYFRVDGIRAATERLTGAGGTVANGPMQVPGGDWIVTGLDPQGALFSLISPSE
jgi:predicted enzyme related to lactoylglutathione lyase